MSRLLLTLALVLLASQTRAEDWTPPDDAFAPQSAQPVHDLTDDELLRAHQAWQSRDQKQLDALAAQASGPLSDYPRYWALEGHLKRGDTYLLPDLQLFLRNYPDSPLTPLLRQKWLFQLGSNQNWRTFEAQFTPDDAHQPALLCYHWQARFSLRDIGFFEEALQYWKSDVTWPSSCDPVFRQLVAAHRLTTDNLWLALRQALSHNRIRQAHYINSFFPPFEGINEDNLSLAEGRPQKFLNDTPPIDSTSRPAQREVWLYALQRLAVHQPQDAINLWNDVAPQLSPQNRDFGWQQLALLGAINLNPQAFEWFQQVSNLPGNDEWKSWKIRVALRQQDWTSVLDTIAQLSAKESQKPVWIYWKAQALSAQHRANEAAALLDQLVNDPTYYGLLVREERHLPLVFLQPIKISDQSAEKPLKTLLYRPLRLYRLGLLTDAQREWRLIEPSLSPVQHWHAARLASQLDWYDRSIHSAEHAPGFMDTTLLFPLPYETTIQSSAHRFNLSDSWIYALIRQESRFFSVALSRTGAQGLMQLMPATARWSARRLNLSRFRSDDANQPDTNILLGSYYFSHLQQLLGNPILATIGYNAGPLRAQRWAANSFPDTRIFIENIPFDETRDYVEQVSYNQIVYQKRLHPESSPRLHDLLNSLSLPHP